MLEALVGRFWNCNLTVSQLVEAAMFLWVVGDQSDLHIIIFDEIDAICKVCPSGAILKS
jgi:hypothetical protein